VVAYESFPAARFFPEITTEAEARTLLWRSRFQDKEFHCPRCHAEQFYALATRPEVRTCKGCRRQWRLRAGTIFESSKTSLLLWVNALFYVMQGKRGISAQELQRPWGLQSYGRVWSMLQKIRAALQHRDAGYQVGDGVIELDAGTFGRAGKPAINATSSWPLRPRPG
jgi:transposase-like protein